MKYLKKIVIIWTVFLVSQSAFAGSGKAIVSHWYALNDGGGNVQHSNFFISNITKNDLIIKITLYNKDGTTYSSGLVYNNFQNNNTEIGAGKSVNFKISAASISTNDSYGYAVIEWSNKGTDDAAVGLVAWADWQQDGQSILRGYSIPINNGNPF